MPKKQTLILASGSPRRRELLEALGMKLLVYSADIDETPHVNEDAKAMVLRLAKAKASVVAKKFSGRWVLAADTIAARNGLPIGKPADAHDAKRTLKALQGRRHEVFTGVCLQKGEKRFSFVAKTEVVMHRMMAKEISWYVATGEPLDKAGSYAVQGLGSLFISKIEGSYSNVNGLPLEKIIDLLRRLGLFHGFVGI